MKEIIIKGWLACILCCIFCISYAQPNITRVEYYVDTDPGYGNGTAISISPSNNLSDKTLNIDPSLYSTGVHVLVIRAKDANGAWSHDNKWVFAKAYPTLPDSTSIPSLTQVEYYFDADPGYGNGIPVAIPENKNLSDIQISTNVTGLSAGLHALFIRAKDANGVWGHDNTDSFNIPSAIASPAINVNSIAAKTSNCARDSFDISYHVTGTYYADNKFNVELSDAAGNFTSPVNIGSYTGAGNSIIKVKLPSHLPEGTNYKVRVNSTNPVVTGVPSTGTITIHDRPNAPTITGAADANNTFSYPYSVPTVSGSTWKWIAPEATVSQTNSIASLTWNTAGTPNTIKIVETNQYGCVGDTSIKTVNVYDLNIDNISVSSLSPCPAGTITVTGAATGVYDEGNIFTAQLSNASGSFASPVNIGTVTANPVGISQPVSINATLPFPLPNGAGYRVRINANSPAVTGADNGEDIVVNKPNLGADKTVSKCPGFMADISSVFATNGLTVEWNTASPASVDAGTYRLIVTNTNGCMDTADVTVTDYLKPDLGADKSTTISCANGTADLTVLYNLSELTAAYSTATPAAAPAGSYTITVTNTDGCKDTAAITVMDAKTATVPSSGSNIKTASRECTDADGWTHYYNDNGTPTDYSDDIRLLSLKKNGNNIGSIGDGTFQIEVAATAGAGSNHAVTISNAPALSGKDFLSMNRYWNITPTTQPTSSVGVRFYYNTQDLADVNGDYPDGNATNTQLAMYKLQDGNPDPTSNWTGSTGISYYTSGSSPSLTDWVYTDLGNNTQQAEFMVSSFSGGGAGIIISGALPVTIISFNAIAQNDKVALQWTTATEVNSREFKIQRSNDGIHFENIGTVAAAGNSNLLRNYVFSDVQGAGLKGQVLYYRILETDLDGKEFYSETRNVKIAGNSNRLALAYNPVRNEALLKYQCASRGNVQVRVVDHLGRVVVVLQQVVQPGMNEIRINTGSLVKGIYEVELSNNRDNYHVRIMKE